MKYTLLLLNAVIIFGCSSGPDNSHIFKVEYKGALKNIMKKGDLSAKANLDDFKDIEHLYALGALENLKGEILVFDGQPLVSSVHQKGLLLSDEFQHNATLLVYASVEKWKTFEIPTTVGTYEEMEQYVEKMATENGININEPFPFLIEGVMRWFDWHIINWKDGDTEHSHHKHIHSGYNGKLFDQDIQILGFYSDSHKGIFTHHTINSHLHFKMKDNTNAGHIDDLQMGKSMVLKLPDVGEIKTKS